MSVLAPAYRPVSVDRALGVDAAESWAGVDAGAVAAHLLVDLAVSADAALGLVLHGLGRRRLGRWRGADGAVDKRIGVRVVGAAAVGPRREKKSEISNFTNRDEFII